MNTTSLNFHPLAIACAVALLCADAAAQSPAMDTPAATAATLGTVTITGRSEPVPSVGGWQQPIGKLPFSAGYFDAEALDAIGAQRLSDLTRLDPAVSDAYNTEGYWDYLTVRGFVIDNRFNYRRDGLPINAETSIPLDNKARVEVLKGTSGLQAGTSAPGGLVNLVVKRPLEMPLRNAEIGWRERRLAARRGRPEPALRRSTQAFGLRLNAAAEKLDPEVRNARGERHLLALAGDWRIGSAHARRGRVRDQPAQPAERARLQPARQPRAVAGRPAHQPEQPAVVAAGRARRQYRFAARHAAARQRLARHRAPGEPAPAIGRPHRISVRLLRRDR